MIEDHQRVSSLQKPSIPVAELLGDKNFTDNRHILWSYPTHVAKKNPEKESSPNKLSIKGILHPSDWQVTPLQAGTPQPLRPLKIKKRGSHAVFRKDLSAFVFHDSLPGLNFESEATVKRNNSISTNNKFDGRRNNTKFLSQTKETTPVNRIIASKKEFSAYESEIEGFMKLSAQNPKIDDMFGPEKKKIDKLPKFSSDIEKMPISFQNLYQKINEMQKENEAKFNLRDKEKAKNDMLLGLKLETKDNQQQGNLNSDQQTSLRASPAHFDIENVQRNGHGIRNKIKSVSGTSKIILSPLIKNNIKARHKSVKHLNPISSGISKRNGEINTAEINKFTRDDMNRSDRLRFTEIAGTNLGYNKDSKDTSQDFRYDDVLLPSTTTFRYSPEPRRSLKPLIESTSIHDPQERILLSITQINTRFMAKEGSPKKRMRSPNIHSSHNQDRILNNSKSPTPLPEAQPRTLSPEKPGDCDNMRTEANITSHLAEEKLYQKKRNNSRCITLETHPFRGSLEKRLADQYGDEDTFEGWENDDESETS